MTLQDELTILGINAKLRQLDFQISKVMKEYEDDLCGYYLDRQVLINRLIDIDGLMKELEAIKRDIEGKYNND